MRQKGACADLPCSVNTICSFQLCDFAKIPIIVLLNLLHNTAIQRHLVFTN